MTEEMQPRASPSKARLHSQKNGNKLEFQLEAHTFSISRIKLIPFIVRLVELGTTRDAHATLLCVLEALVYAMRRFLIDCIKDEEQYRSAKPSAIGLFLRTLRALAATLLKCGVFHGVSAEDGVVISERLQSTLRHARCMFKASEKEVVKKSVASLWNSLAAVCQRSSHAFRAPLTRLLYDASQPGQPYEGQFAIGDWQQLLRSSVKFDPEPNFAGLVKTQSRQVEVKDFLLDLCDQHSARGVKHIKTLIEGCLGSDENATDPRLAISLFQAILVQSDPKLVQQHCFHTESGEKLPEKVVFCSSMPAGVKDSEELFVHYGPIAFPLSNNATEVNEDYALLHQAPPKSFCYVAGTDLVSLAELSKKRATQCLEEAQKQKADAVRERQQERAEQQRAKSEEKKQEKAERASAKRARQVEASERREREREEKAAKIMHWCDSTQDFMVVCAPQNRWKPLEVVAENALGTPCVQLAFSSDAAESKYARNVDVLRSSTLTAHLVSHHLPSPPTSVESAGQKLVRVTAASAGLALAPDARMSSLHVYEAKAFNATFNVVKGDCAGDAVEAVYAAVKTDEGWNHDAVTDPKRLEEVLKAAIALRIAGVGGVDAKTIKTRAAQAEGVACSTIVCDLSEDGNPPTSNKAVESLTSELWTRRVAKESVLEHFTARLTALPEVRTRLAAFADSVLNDFVKCPAVESGPFPDAHRETMRRWKDRIAASLSCHTSDSATREEVDAESRSDS